MDDRGEALVLSAADTLKIVYSAAGTDTVTVTLTTDYGTATATAVVNVADCQPVTSFPWYEGFEQSLACWDTPAGYRSWSKNSSYTHSGAYCLKSNTTSSQNSLIVSQPVVVPSDAYMLRLGLWARLSGPSSTSIHRNVSILVVGADCSDWSTATVLGTASANVQYCYFGFPLDAYAGQTVRFGLRYANSDYSAIVDDIVIRYTREPVGSLASSSARIYGEDTVTATVTLTEGDTVGLSYQWESLMADHGLADYIGSNGAQMRFAYHGVGIDTIIVVVTNAYGTFTDTAFVRVCPVQDTLPWVANFAADLPCWQVLQGTCSVHSSGYLSLEDWPTTVVTPPVWVPDYGNVVLEYDCAYSFFYGSTLVMVTTDMTTFDTLSEVPFTTGTHPSTRIPLGAYAGQYVRVVFKATGQFLQYYLANVQIRYALEPVVQVEADDGYFPGTPVTLTASLLEGDTTSLIYSWASTMAQRGEATLTFDGGPQATLTPIVGGLDTVTVWATNMHGTDSTTIVVDIKPCGTVDTLPWVENFSNQFACWWQPDGSQWTLPDDPSYTMAVAVNVWMPTDSWLVSRAITLPTLPVGVNDELLLCWDATSQINDTHSYCVMITTAPDYRDLSAYDTLIAIDTVHPDYSVGWNAMRARLSAYAGQTVHLAFRYTTAAWEPNGQLPGILMIDNVRIIDTIASVGPTPPPTPDTVWRTVTVTANVSGACEPYGSGLYVDSSTVEIGYQMLDTATVGGYWHFLGWNDGGVGNPRNLFVTSDTAIVALFEWVADSVGIEVVSGQWPVASIYPNPAHGEVTVSVSQPSTVTVLDMTGRVVIPPTPITSDLRLQTSGLPSGVYFVRVGSTVKKLIVK